MKGITHSYYKHIATYCTHIIAMKAYGGSVSVDPLIIHLGTTSRLGVSFMSRPFYPGTEPTTH